MKKFLAALLAVFLSCGPVFAANTATAQTALPIRVGGAGYVVPYKVTFDTTASDLTVVTPGSGKMACIVGMTFSEASASNVTFTSGSTSLLTLELAANSGVYDKISNGAFFCTQPGEA